MPSLHQAFVLGSVALLDVGSAAILDSFGGPIPPTRDLCPISCRESGSDPSQWTTYPSIERLSLCGRSLLLDFSINTPIEEDDSIPVKACSVWSDFPSDATLNTKNLTATDADLAKATAGSQGSDVDAIDAHLAATYLQRYMASTDSAEESSIMFATSGSSALGLYVGANIDSVSTSKDLIHEFLKDIKENGVSQQTILQLCGSDRNADMTMGIVASTGTDLSAVQKAVQTWATGHCVAAENHIAGKATVSVFALGDLKMPANSTYIPSNSTESSAGIHDRSMADDGDSLSLLEARATCKNVKVVSGDGCPSLAKKCGITPAAFTKLHPKKTFCSTLKPGQHVCCNKGKLPDFSPKPQPDGTCATYKIKNKDDCSQIAASHSLTVAKLENFNKNTWGWNGCKLLYPGNKMCLSKGTHPMPAPVGNAECGPQVPGTKKPKAGVSLASLNPCPLNACCDVWGQCGTTADYCTDTNTGAPGTAKKGTNGCISHCSTKVIQSSAPATFRKIAYFEGYNLDSRDCLYMDADQLQGNGYTHVHYGFATLNSDFTVRAFNTIPGRFEKYEWKSFMAQKGFKRIVSFGGWDFSTSPKTYMIFRQGVTAAHREKMATSIANFVINHGLDGVDIDWEYPGAPDIPDIPAASKSDGDNYLAFLKLLKKKLKGKSLSIAAPASYWYLKGFPIKKISPIVDYIVYMTYDLHGLWDFGNQWSDTSCPTGNCLRSGINYTETVNALSMITKAGAPSNKVVVGVTSYGRSFQMANPSCSGPMCKWVKTAKKGRCTNVAGYLGNAEIEEIISTNPSAKTSKDSTKAENRLIYDKNQWVTYMDAASKKTRTTRYRNMNLGGTSDWAVDLASFRESPVRHVPGQSINDQWNNFKNNVKLNGNPYTVGERTGNWSSLDCEDRGVQDLRNLTPDQRWGILDCDHAWKDVLKVWRTIDNVTHNLAFVESISDTFHAKESMNCTDLHESNCDDTITCQDAIGDGTGPAGYFIINAMINVHEALKNWYDAIESAHVSISDQFDQFMDDFAPAPPDEGLFNVVLDLIGLGVTALGARFFEAWLPEAPFFVAHPERKGEIKDDVMGVITTVLNIIKDKHNNEGEWTKEDSDGFLVYTAAVFDAWRQNLELLAKSLWDGHADHIPVLTELIADGKSNAGSRNGHAERSTDGKEGITTTVNLQKEAAYIYWGFIIPKYWILSGSHSFIIDSGVKCGASNPIDRYLTDDYAEDSKVCDTNTNKQYYLVSARGKAQNCDCGPPCNNGQPCPENRFTLPNGLDKLDGTSYGGVTRKDFVMGSIATYNKNGKKNGGVSVDPSEGKTIGQAWDSPLLTPGYISLPICSAEEAFGNWLYSTTFPSKERSKNYPCD